MNCKECEHYQNQTCIWNYDYLDTDYAYDCCDFIHKKENYHLKIYIFKDKKYKKEKKMTGDELIGFIIANHLEDYEFIRYNYGDRHDIYPEIDEDNHQVLI